MIAEIECFICKASQQFQDKIENYYDWHESENGFKLNVENLFSENVIDNFWNLQNTAKDVECDDRSNYVECNHLQNNANIDDEINSIPSCTD